MTDFRRVEIATQSGAHATVGRPAINTDGLELVLGGRWRIVGSAVIYPSGPGTYSYAHCDRIGRFIRIGAGAYAFATDGTPSTDAFALAFTAEGAGFGANMAECVSLGAGEFSVNCTLAGVATDPSRLVIILLDRS